MPLLPRPTIDEATALHALLRALPKGKLWSRETDTNLAELLRVLGSEVKVLYDLAELVVSEGNPQSTSFLIDEWERSVGLPDACSGGPLLLLTRRRAAVVQRIATALGWTINALEESAELAGYEVEIENAVTADCVGTCEAFVGDELWPASFIVKAPEYTWTGLEFGCPLGDPFAAWGNDLLECVINRTKPSDKWPYFLYVLEPEPGPWMEAQISPGGVVADAPSLEFEAT